MILTADELAAIQSLPRKTPYMIDGVSRSQFSIARYYGGILFNGAQYDYDAATDTLVRADVKKAVRKMRRAEKKLARESAQGGLL